MRSKASTGGYMAAVIFAITAGQLNPVSLTSQNEKVLVIESSRELAAVSERLIRNDPELALAFALEATRKARTAEAEDALRNALLESRVRTILRTPVPAGVADADMSPDGRTIVTAESRYSPQTRTETAAVRWWDVATGRELRSISPSGGGFPSNIAFSPDGRRVIFRQNSGMRLLDADTGEQIHEFSGSGLITPDGRYFAYRGNSTVHVWDAVTGREQIQFESEYNPSLFSPTSGLMAMIGEMGREPVIHIFDTAIKEYVAELPVTESHYSGAFSPDGKLLATAAKCAWGNYDPTVHVWNAKTGSTAAVLPTGCVAKVLFSPDERNLLTIGDDGIGRTWDTKTWKDVSTLTGNASWVWSAAFSADSRFIVAGGGDTRPRIWEAATGKVIAELCGHTGAIRKTSFTPDGNGVLTAGDDGTIRLWDAHAGMGSLELVGLGARAWQGAFSPDGTRVLTTGQTGTVLVWETRTGTELFRLGPHRDSVTYAEFSRDGRFILTASLDGRARFWNAKNGKLIFEKDAHGKFTDARLSPDGLRLVARGGGTSAGLWSTTTQKPLGGIGHAPNYVGEVAFSPNGKYIISTCADCSTARIWDADTGKELTKLGDHHLGTSFSPDSRHIVGSSANGTIHIWSVATGRVLATLKSSTAQQMAAFAPDGRHIVTCAMDGKTCSTWQTGTWREVVSFQGKANFGGGNPFSPNGRFLLVHDGEAATIVEIASGKPVSRLSRQRAKINGATFSPDGRYAATFNEDGTTVVYPWEMFAPLDDILTLAAKRIHRPIACEERRLYLHGPPCTAKTP